MIAVEALLEEAAEEEPAQIARTVGGANNRHPAGMEDTLQLKKKVHNAS